MKYSIELLDQTTKLVFIIQEQLNCSFDEACATAKIIFQKVNNNEIRVDKSLKSLLPQFLEQARNAH